jgi:hypothetical protein
MRARYRIGPADDPAGVARASILDILANIHGSGGSGHASHSALWWFRRFGVDSRRKKVMGGTPTSPGAR